MATIRMKVFALNKLGHIYERALRYSLGLPLSTVIVGCSSMEELEKDHEVAENFVPLSDEERLELFAEAIPLVKPANLAWKADGWQTPSRWAGR